MTKTATLTFLCFGPTVLPGKRCLWSWVFLVSWLFWVWLFRVFWAFLVRVFLNLSSIYRLTILVLFRQSYIWIAQNNSSKSKGNNIKLHFWLIIPSSSCKDEDAKFIFWAVQVIKSITNKFFRALLFCLFLLRIFR